MTIEFSHKFTKEKKAQIKIDRALRRRKKRREKYHENKKTRGIGSSYCHSCGGTMTWCIICQTWSRNCCVDWGTCMCS